MSDQSINGIIAGAEDSIEPKSLSVNDIIQQAESSVPTYDLKPQIPTDFKVPQEAVEQIKDLWALPELKKEDKPDLLLNRIFDQNKAVSDVVMDAQSTLKDFMRPIEEVGSSYMEAKKAVDIQISAAAKVQDALIRYSPEQIEANPNLIDDILTEHKQNVPGYQDKSGLNKMAAIAGGAMAFSLKGVEAGIKARVASGLAIGMKGDPRIAAGIEVFGTTYFAYKEFAPILRGMAFIEAYQDPYIRENVPIAEIKRVSDIQGTVDSIIEVASTTILGGLLPSSVSKALSEPVKKAAKSAFMKNAFASNAYRVIKAGVKSKTGKFLLGSGTEVLEENLQIISEVAGKNYLTAFANELSKTNVPLKDTKYVLKQMADQLDENIIAALATGGTFAAVGFTAENIKNKVISDTNNRLEQEALDNFDLNLEDAIRIRNEEIKQEQKDNLDAAPVIPGQNVVDEENRPIKTSHAYVDTVDQYERGKKSVISDERVEDLILSSDQDLDGEVNDVLKETFTGDEYYSEFRLGLREFLSKDKSDAIETLVQARADATDRTIEEYLKDHKLSVLPQINKDMGDIYGSVRFVNDGQTIIQAFKGANVSTMAHELGHVFRRDLGAEDLSTIESWLGVKDGEWTVEQEELFVQGWEFYLQDGKAPSAQLETVFAKFSRWISEIYKTFVRNNAIDQISPEARQVYDNLLTKMDEAGAVLQDAKETTLFQARKIKFEKDVEQTLEEGIEVKDDVGTISTFEAFKKKIIGHVKSAQKAALEGNQETVARERARIKELFDRASKRKSTTKERNIVKNKIRSLVTKYSKVKTVKGRKVNTITDPVTFTYVKSINELIAPKKETLEAGEKRQERVKKEYYKLHDKIAEEFSITNEGKLEDTQLTTEDSVRYHVLQMAAFPKQQTTKGLNELYEDLKGIIETGKSQKLAQIQAEAKRHRDARLQLARDMGFLGIETPTDLKLKGQDPNEKVSFWERASSGFNPVTGYMINGWHNFMEGLGRYSGKMVGESFAEKFGETVDQENAEAEGNRTQYYQLIDGFKEAYGFDSSRKAYRALFNMNLDVIELPEVEVVHVKKVEGERVEEMTMLQEGFTKPQMWQRILELQHSNPVVRKTLIETMGYKDSDGGILLNSKRGKLLASQMTDEDWKMINLLKNFYELSYHSLNKVYLQQNGTDLYHHKNYVPISRGIYDTANAEPEDSLLQGMFQESAAVTTGRIKEISNNFSPLTKRSAVEVASQYIVETEHYKAWAQKIRDFNAVFMDKRVVALMKKRLGNQAPEMIRSQLYLMTFGKRKGIKNTVWLDRLRVGMTRSALAIAPSLTVKQLMSHPAFIVKMGIKNYFKYSTEFFKNPIENVKALKEESLFIKNRPLNMERDIRDATIQKQNYGGKFSKLQKLNLTPYEWNKLMANIRIGDVAPIYVGVWALKEYYIQEKGMSSSDALRQAEIVARNSQQSAAFSMQSYFQSGGSLTKVASMFTSATVLYQRKEIEAIRALVDGRWNIEGDAKQSRENRQLLIRQIAIYHFVLPMLFQAITDLDWDPEHQARAAVLGSFNNLVLLGPLLNKMINGVLGHTNDFFGGDLDFRKDRWQGDLTSTLPATQPFIDITDFVIKEKLKKKDFVEAINAAFIFAGRPIPVKRLDNMFIEGAVDLWEGMRTQDKDLYQKGIFRLAGWGESVATPKKPLTQKQKRAKRKRERKQRQK